MMVKPINKGKQSPTQSKPVVQEKPMTEQVNETVEQKPEEAIASSATGVSDQSVVPTPEAEVVEKTEAAAEQAPAEVAKQESAETVLPVDEGAAGTVVTETPAPVVAATPAPVVEVAKPSTDGLSTMAQTYLAQIDTYLEAMAPRKPIDEPAGIRQQVSLFRALTRIIDNLDEDFRATWTAVLAKWLENKDGALSERYVMRFMAGITLTKDEIRAFQLLLDLIRMSAEPTTRGNVLKQYDMEKLFKYGFSEKGRRNLNAFYGR